MEKLDNLLKNCTVRFSADDGSLIGTGFFITKNKILTAAHNITTKGGCQISHPVTGKAIVSRLNQIKENVDFGIIEVEENESFQVGYIGTDFNIDNDLVVVGYSFDNPFGDTITLKLEGESSNKKNETKYKVKDGQVSKGISGSPVFCKETNQIVGIIVETRNRNLPVGGYFISISEILKFDSSILMDNRLWHLKHTNWNLISDRGNNIIDETWQPKHFNVFPTHNIDVEEIYIEACFQEITFRKGEFEEASPDSTILGECLDIIETQNILLITGPYGSGKSILTKCIQKKLIEKGYNTLFITANNIQNEHVALHEFIRDVTEKIRIQNKLYIILDAFDELNSLESDNIFSFLEQLCRVIKQNDCTLIINYRTLESINYIDQYEYLCLIIQQEFEIGHIRLIKLKEFTSVKVSEWMANYSFLMQKNGTNKEFTKDLLRNAHKNLIVACHNPLFLYIVSQDFYKENNELHSISNIYDLYETFVRNTVKGKFSVETNLGTKVLQDLARNYIDFLKEIALNIAEQSKMFTINSIVDSDEHLLDDNTELFGISSKELTTSVNNIINLILPYKNNLRFDKIDQKLLNCYFFEQSGNVWRFRDNNILFFFLAEKLFTSIKTALVSVEDIQKTEEIFAKIKNAAKIPLHPIILELLLKKLKSLPKTDKKSLVFLLRTFIDEQYFLSIPKQPVDLNIDFEKLNLDIFLCILFVQLNEAGYKEISFFFKRFMWLLSVAKRLNPNMVFLAKRFYKSAKISAAEFRRVNLKGCNFDETEMRNVKFIQSKIHFVRNNNSKFQDVNYLLCDFHKTEMNEIFGNIQFDNCIINSLIFKSPNEQLTLNFERCNISRLEIFADSLVPIYLCFKNCLIEEIFIKKSKILSLKLEYNVINVIKVNSSKIYYSQNGNVKKLGEIFKEDHLSEIREVENS